MALVSSPPPLTSQNAAKITSPDRPVGTPLFSPRFSQLARRTSLWHCYSQARKNLDHIPKQFHEENLVDGLMDNYKNVPECLYGLTPEQMNMFMAKDNILTRQAAKVTAESISSAGFYERLSNITSLEERGENKKEHRKYDMRVSMYRGVATPDEPPPDLPSLLLDARIIFLGMPLYQAVTELIIAQLLYLSFEDSSKPIYLYINSTGTQDEKMEVIGCETEGFAIADTMDFCKAKVHTLNLGTASGQAAMILSRGDKGNRLLFPHSSTRLYLPKIFRSNGPTSDMWVKAKDLEANADSFLELLSDGVGKPKEEVAKDIKHVKYFNAEEAIEYGIADRIIHSMADTLDKQNAMERNARVAMREAAKAARSGTGAVASSGLG